MFELAQCYGQGPLSLCDIAESQGLSEKYLEALLSRLRAAGLLAAQRGPQGGYVLARSPERISLRDIYDALENPEPYAPCTIDPTVCERWASCITRQVWADMYEASMRVLESTSLADLMSRAVAKADAGEMYHI